MATDAPDTLREVFFDADRRVGQGLATYGELDATAFDGLETIEDVSADATAMDLLAASEAYQEVARSVVAMEAQAADPTAMDAVSTSSTAMDAVSTSSTAMDAVSASQTAMDAVSASTLALSKFHLSESIESSYWPVANSSSTWDSGTITTNSGMSVFTGQSGDSLGNGSFSTPIEQGYSIGAVLDNSGGTGEGKWQREFDFDEISEVVLTTLIDNSSAFAISLSVGGAELLNYNSNGETTHTVSVSQTGTQTLTIEFVDQNFTDGEFCEAGLLQFN